jgi:hypothetical protein
VVIAASQAVVEATPAPNSIVPELIVIVFEANTAPIVAIAGKGVLVRNGAKPAVEPLARCLGDVMRRVEPGDPIRPIDAANVERLLNWDAEIYRQNLKRS